MPKMKFFMKELANDGSEITLVPVKPLRDEKQFYTLLNAFNNRVVLEIDFPDPTPANWSVSLYQSK